MTDSKEMLEATVKGLQEKLDQVNNDLKAKQRELDDASKPELTQSQLDTIGEVVETKILDALNDLDVSYDIDIDLELSGNEIGVYSIEWQGASEKIAGELMQGIDNEFKIIDDE
tara:strand:+ start:86 stop:427 length:342 start_codon:yes stop_codon:yes gene_type:complete